MRRRQYLGAVVTGVIVSAAGCQSSDNGNEGATDSNSEESVDLLLDSEPSSCPPQSRSDVEAMPASPDGYTVSEAEFNEDGDDVFDFEDDTTHYADEIEVWYNGTDEATYRLQIHIWDSASVAEEDSTFSAKAIIYKGDEEYEMATGLKARLEHLTLNIRTDSGGQSGVETTRYRFSSLP